MYLFDHVRLGRRAVASHDIYWPCHLGMSHPTIVPTPKYQTPRAQGDSLAILTECQDAEKSTTSDTLKVVRRDVSATEL